MLVFQSAQLEAWAAAYLWPLARILGLFAVAPMFGNQGIPARIRLIAGIAIALAIVPTLPSMPSLPLASWAGLLTIAFQVLIGVVMGFAARLLFTAIDMAGELMGLQMGLGFAVFYDPGSNAQTPVIADFLGAIGMLMFLAMNGHLMFIDALARSFTLIPVGPDPLAAQSMRGLLGWGGYLFGTGVLMALPLVVALLVTNLALGVLSRAAPQLNLFAIGFPVTITAGFAMLFLCLSYIAPNMLALFEHASESMLGVAQMARPR